MLPARGMGEKQERGSDRLAGLADLDSSQGGDGEPESSCAIALCSSEARSGGGGNGSDGGDGGGSGSRGDDGDGGGSGGGGDGVGGGAAIQGREPPLLPHTSWSSPLVPPLPTALWYQ